MDFMIKINAIGERPFDHAPVISKFAVIIKIKILRKEAISALAGFDAGPLS